MERWVEHFKEPYSTENTVSETAINAIEELPIMHELDSLEREAELDQAIVLLHNEKAPGSDGIPSEVLKFGGPLLRHKLYELLCHCCREGLIPQSMRN